MHRTKDHAPIRLVFRWLLCAAFVTALVASAAAQTLTVGTADPTRFLNDIKTLTVPAMEGRGDDTKGIALATRLLGERYKGLGLEPVGTQGFLQPFSLITGAKLTGNNHLRQQVGNTSKDLKLNDDFVPFSFSASGQADAQVVFAGYGASAAEFGYDDYAGIDVKGKIVVLLRYEPPSFATKGGNQGQTQHASLITKAINARNHGAKAVVVVNGNLGKEQQDLLTRFGSVSGPENAGIILVQVKNSVAEAWFAAVGKSMPGVQNQINTSTKPVSFAFPESLRLTLSAGVESTRATVNNVLAYLPGKTSEYVIVGAH